MRNGSGLFQGQRSRRPHLVRGPGGLASEISDLRGDIVSSMNQLVALTVDEYTAPLPGDIPGLKTAFATVTAPVILLPPDFDAGIDVTVLATETGAPRRIIITTGGSTPSDAPANAIVKGRDARGGALEETLVLSQTTGNVVSDNFYASLGSVELEAGDGTSATLAFGYTGRMGLRRPLKVKVTEAASPVLMGIEAGVVVAVAAIAATFTEILFDPPFGSYLPITVPDGSNDYAVYYEYDPTI